MKKNQVLLIAGLTLITSPVILTNQHVSDPAKGLLAGIGIGFLILSLIIQLKKPKSI